MQMADRDDYRFLQLKDAVTCLNQKVNLIGVVIESGFPRKTKGTDCFCTFKVVDQSYCKPGISVNVFAENMEMLPHVQSGADIIQLSHVVMKSHDGEVYALFNKKFSSFALYKGENGQDFLPYQVSARFHPRDQDKKFVDSLRNWLQDFQQDKGPENVRSLKEIKEGVRVDLVCKLLRICKVGSDMWMAFVWDGTDTPPVSICQKVEEEKDDPLPLNIEPLPFSRDFLCEFPAIGSVLRVFIDKSIEKHGLDVLNAGKWVTLVNVLCEVHKGLWRGVLMPFSKVRYMLNNDNIILEQQRHFDKRLSDKCGKMPFWSFPWPSRVTEIDHENAPFATLMDILKYPKVNAKFRCVVRVVIMLPWRAEDFRCPRGIYRVRLTLEDPTARVHAYVYAEDGEKFFDGYPSPEELTRKQNKLLGVPLSVNGKKITDAPRNPPWVQCCIKSYYLDRNNPWETRNFRIFDTKLVG